jgi:hypothetical protein
MRVFVCVWWVMLMLVGGLGLSLIVLCHPRIPNVRHCRLTTVLFFTFLFRPGAGTWWAVGEALLAHCAWLLPAALPWPAGWCDALFTITRNLYVALVR